MRKRPCIIPSRCADNPRRGAANFGIASPTSSANRKSSMPACSKRRPWCNDPFEESTDISILHITATRQGHDRRARRNQSRKRSPANFRMMRQRRRRPPVPAVSLSWPGDGWRLIGGSICEQRPPTNSRCRNSVNDPARACRRATRIAPRSTGSSSRSARPR
jgi:hypothetical protein